MQTVEECVAYINNIPRFPGQSTFEDTGRLLDRIVLPENTKIIHIAGTNGKGSTASYMDSILRASGLSTGLFTSPHLIRMNERIVYNNRPISDEEFIEAFEYVSMLIKEEGDINHPSFFEYVFLMAMHYYSKKCPEYIILETGLGGRMDATNLVKRKSLSVITGIGFDHMEYLGDTLEEIAGEKAGIIMPGVPVVFFDQEDEAAQVIRSYACAVNSSLCSVKNADIKVNDIGKDSIDFSVGCEYYKYDGLIVSTVASYQAKNAALAILGIITLEDERINESSIRKGLKTALWSGRMELLRPGIYIDGAHNTHGIRAFLSSVAGIPGGNKRHLLFSVVADKQYEEMVDMIYESGLFEDVYVSHIDSYRALDIEKLKATFDRYKDMKVYYYERPEDALDTLINTKAEQDFVFIAGSLYLAGQLLTKYKE